MEGESDWRVNQAFSLFKLLGELYVVMFDSDVFAFRPICVSKSVIFVIPCGVIRSVLIISATLDAILNGEIFGSIFMTPICRLGVCISRSTTPIDLLSSTGANRNFMLFDLQNNWNFLARNF